MSDLEYIVAFKKHKDLYETVMEYLDEAEYASGLLVKDIKLYYNRTTNEPINAPNLLVSAFVQAIQNNMNDILGNAVSILREELLQSQERARGDALDFITETGGAE